MSYTLSNFHPSASKTPFHVGLIPDGTRRWAKKQEIPLLDAYKIAMEKLIEYIGYIFDQGSGVMSVYGASVQNFSRSKSDVSAFSHAEAYFCRDLLPTLCEHYETKVEIAGDRSIIPDYFMDAIQYIERSTCQYAQTKLHLCIAYNPLDEIEHACSITQEGENFLEHLWVKEPLDMVIRTDVNLLSNFLPLQAGFARLYFIDKLFDETTLSDISRIYDSFKKINRVYGK